MQDTGVEKTESTMRHVSIRHAAVIVTLAMASVQSFAQAPAPAEYVRANYTKYPPSAPDAN